MTDDILFFSFYNNEKFHNGGCMGSTQEKKTKKPKSSLNKWMVAFLVIVVINLGVVGFMAIDHQSNVNPQFCASCHNMESHVDSYLNSNHLDQKHFQAGVECKECHSDYTKIEQSKSLVNYVLKNYDEKFSRIKVEDDMCLQCHIGGENLAAKTDFLVRNPHESHWPNAKCADCHRSHDSQIDYCARCHDNGGQRMIEKPIIPRAENPWANEN